MPQLWSIYHVDDCRHSTPQKGKYVAIVCEGMECYHGFLINSRIHPWLLKDPYRKSCQVPILASTNKIPHDSYINCFQIYSFPEDELVNLQGALSAETKEDIKKVVFNSITINNFLRKLILK